MYRSNLVISPKILQWLLFSLRKNTNSHQVWKGLQNPASSYLCNFISYCCFFSYRLSSCPYLAWVVECVVAGIASSLSSLSCHFKRHLRRCLPSLPSQSKGSLSHASYLKLPIKLPVTNYGFMTALYIRTAISLIHSTK